MFETNKINHKVAVAEAEGHILLFPIQVLLLIIVHPMTGAVFGMLSYHTLNLRTAICPNREANLAGASSYKTCPSGQVSLGGGVPIDSHSNLWRLDSVTEPVCRQLVSPLQLVSSALICLHVVTCDPSAYPAYEWICPPIVTPGTVRGCWR